MPDSQPALLLNTILVPSYSTDLSTNSDGGLNANNLLSALPNLSANQRLEALPAATVASGSGLLGQYYDNSDLTNLKLTRIDSTIDFTWLSGESPGTDIAPTTFSVRWSGAVEAQYSEAYTFYTASDDGIRLWVNGQQLINNWTDHSPTEDKGTISLVSGQKYDIKIEYYQASGGAKSQLWWSSLSQAKSLIPQLRLYEPDLTLPTASLPSLVPDAVTNDATYGFTAVYSDLTGVNRSTIDGQDVLVTGPNNFSQLATLVSVSNDSNATSLTATYRINAPSGSWNANTVGLYSIILQGNQVKDIDDNSIPTETLGTFRATVTPPKVSLDPLTLVTQGAADYGFRVYYESLTSLNRATIDNQDILVTGPNSFSQLAQLTNIITNTNSSVVIANYRFAAPNGVWGTTDTGTYTLTLQANQVGDASNNFILTQTLGLLQVDFTLPTATLVPLLPVTSDSTNYQFSVAYSDDSAVKLETIDDQDILVSGPNNFSQFAKLVQVSGAENGSSLVAVYGINAPDGVWDVADQGTYTLTLQANQVSDVSNNFSPASVLGTFRVDLSPPSAKLTLANFAAVGEANSRFTVLYRDDTAVKRSTITPKNVQVTGPNNFSQTASLVDVSSPSDAGFLIATYSITAPGEVWDTADTGTYTIALQTNQISDLDGNFTPASVLGTVIVDLTSPTPSLIASNIAVGRQSDYDFQVVYRDDTAVKRSTLDNQNLLVTGPNNFSQLAILVGVNSEQDGSSLTATYRITAPDSVWDATTQGMYTIALQANQVSDISGNFTASGSLGTFSVGQIITYLGDFDGDGKADILVRNLTSQKVSVLLVNGTTLKEKAVLPNLAPTVMIAAIADFDGDGKADILWRDANNQKVSIWLMNGTELKGAAFLPDIPSNYTIVDTADFDGDGKADILWRDANNQKVSVWLMNGTELKGAAFLPDVPSSYTIVDTADFDGDGKADILWRDANNQKVLTWLMNGIKLKGAAFLPNIPSNYTIVDTADFDGDGKADILWRDANNQKVSIWLMNGTELKGAAFLPDIPSNYTIVDTADFDGDGKADILWRDAANQKVSIWLMNGTELKGAAFLPDIPSSYTIVDTADFDGDGKADILWRDAANQKISIWLVSGTQVVTAQSFSTGFAKIVVD